MLTFHCHHSFLPQVALVLTGGRKKGTKWPFIHKSLQYMFFFWWPNESVQYNQFRSCTGWEIAMNRIYATKQCMSRFLHLAGKERWTSRNSGSTINIKSSPSPTSRRGPPAPGQDSYSLSSSLGMNLLLCSAFSLNRCFLSESIRGRSLLIAPLMWYFVNWF